jgi:hypothetical protein
MLGWSMKQYKKNWGKKEKESLLFFFFFGLKVKRQITNSNIK